MKTGDKGEYVLPAIPPHCAELRIPATLIEIRPNGRILLKDDGMANYYVDTTAESFIPHTP